MQQEINTLSEELFRLLTEHINSDCSGHCCVRDLLNNLKKNSLGEPTQDRIRKPTGYKSGAYAYE